MGKSKESDKLKCAPVVSGYGCAVDTPLGCRSTNTPRYAINFADILRYSSLEFTYRLIGHKVIGLSKRILNYALSCV